MDAAVFTAAGLAACAVAAVADARTGRIPNTVTLPALGFGLIAHAAGGAAAGALAVLGVVCAAGLPWVMHRATEGRAIGGGDVKLFAALGALAGPVDGVRVLLSSFLLLSLLALCHLALRGKLLCVLANAVRLLANPVLPRRLRRAPAPEALTEMRLGPAIFAGSVLVALGDRVAPWLP